MSIDKLKNAFSHATWKNDVKHYFKKINEIIDYLNNLVSYNPPYEIYTALLTQVGTNAPTATVLENTLGVTITYQYDVVGQYYASFTTDVNKTVVTIGNTSATLGTAYIYSAGAVGSFLNINTWNTSGVGANDVLINTLIEIRVYN